MIWKEIEGFEGLYEVSDNGKVRRMERVFQRRDGKILPISSRELKLCIDKYGYVYVCLQKGKDRIHKTIHRLVLETFTSAKDLQVNHIDGNKLNNNLSNLEWVTSKENINHSIITGLRKYSNKAVGKFVDDELVEKYSSAQEAADRNNISKTCVILRCTGKRCKRNHKVTYKYL